jgi:predicted metal-binding membrane protein
VGRRLTRAAGSTAVVVSAALAASLAAWAVLDGLSPLHPHHPSIPTAAFWWDVMMWQAMMVAMMTPTVTPWVVAYGRLVNDQAGRGAVLPSLAFAAGYFAIWSAYSIGAAAVQTSMTAAGWVGHDEPPRLLAAGVLVGAGLFQFVPFRQACLTHCRNPLSYLVARSRDGQPSPFRLGFAHGAYCVGCCWLLMLTGVAVGLMNLAWMAALTVLIAVEQTAPGGAWLGRLFGAGLVSWGVCLAWPA